MNTRIFITSLLGLLIAGLVLYTWHLNAKVEQLSNLEPVQVTDTVTLTNWQYDTAYITNTKVETLRLVDTAFLSDTAWLTDSVYVQVEVPLSKYVYDTLISTDSSKTHLMAVCEGFSVTLDSLSIQYEKVHQEAKKPIKKWYQHLAPALGVGYGTSGFGLFIGVGYTL